MPSFSHEMLVDLFRSCAELAPALLEACGRIAVPHADAALASIDLSQVTSTEYRADAVVVLRDPRTAPVAAIVIEVQLSVDPRKRRSWPVYIATLAARMVCPVYLLVLAPDAAVARWARAPILLGHPGFQLAPLVIDLGEIPRVTDLAAASHLPELAVLSAIAHPEADIARTALLASKQLSEERAKLYCDVVLDAVGPPLREELLQMLKILGLNMLGQPYKSEFAQHYYAQGHTEGLRSAAIKLLEARLGALTDDERAAIAAVHDHAALGALIDALARATTSDDVRAALAAAPRAATGNSGMQLDL